MTRKKIGIYSKKQKRLVKGLNKNRVKKIPTANIWRHEDGREVTITEVNESGQSKFDDAKIVGPVVEWLRHA